MINPQMMGINNFENVPTIKELWKDEKQKYRHWIILFGLGLLIVFAFYLTSFILNILDKSAIVLQLTQDFKINNNSDIVMKVNNYWITNFLVFPLIVLSLIGTGLFLYIVTIIRSYRHHSFAKIAPWALHVIGLGAVLSFIEIIFTLAQSRLNFTFAGTIFAFITRILFIVIYFTASVRVSRIRRQFVYSEYVQNFKSKLNLKETKQQDINSPFVGQTNLMNDDQVNEKFRTITSAPLDKVSEQYNKLKNMSLNTLKEIAQRLSISGAEVMKREELIDTIIRVSSNKN